jgi:hypothetical protein
VQFSHEHHVAGLGIDCRYCHTSVEHTNYAGMPSTKTCMTCHSQIWTNAELLKPVRDSFREDKPIRWTRVHDLPDYVQFNHSIHVQKGIGCVSCHGRVDQMPLMWKTQSLYMEWCLSCHREPEKHVRPRDKVFDLNWQWPADVDGIAEGKKLVEKYRIATWDYPVHNRAVANPHSPAADPHGTVVNPHAAGADSPAAPKEHAGGDPHPVSPKVLDSKGVAAGPIQKEWQPNPLTNCSVCHY